METDYINLIFEGFIDIYNNPRNAIMWIIAGFLMYFGIAKKKEPLLLVPISFGVLLANLPLGELVKPSSGEGEPMGFLLFFQENGLSRDQDRNRTKWNNHPGTGRNFSAFGNPVLQRTRQPGASGGDRVRFERIGAGRPCLRLRTGRPCE